jgi:hypothetical protein
MFLQLRVLLIYSVMIIIIRVKYFTNTCCLTPNQLDPSVLKSIEDDTWKHLINAIGYFVQ